MQSQVDNKVSGGLPQAQSTKVKTKPLLSMTREDRIMLYLTVRDMNHRYEFLTLKRQSIQY